MPLLYLCQKVCSLNHFCPPREVLHVFVLQGKTFSHFMFSIFVPILLFFLIYICFSLFFFVNRCSSGNDDFTDGRPSRQAGWQLYSTLPIILGESPSEKVAVEYLPVSAAISIIVKSIFQWVCGIVFPWKI